MWLVKRISTFFGIFPCESFCSKMLPRRALSSASGPGRNPSAVFRTLYRQVGGLEKGFPSCAHTWRVENQCDKSNSANWQRLASAQKTLKISSLISVHILHDGCAGGRKRVRRLHALRYSGRSPCRCFSPVLIRRNGVLLQGASTSISRNPTCWLAANRFLW